MKTKTIVIGALLILLAAINLAAAADVTCALDKGAVRVGEGMTVTFNQPLPKSGEKYWITLIPAGQGDDQWGEWKYVDAGVSSVAVDGPKSAGNYEVRLHDKYSAMPYHVICRMPVTAGGGAQPSGMIALTLAKSTIKVGEKQNVTFNVPLPKEGEKYWITVAPASSPDSEWGQWKYVDAGVSQVELDAVPAAGSYEVRLHDHYSAQAFHVIARQPLTVK
jgi:hypothetical protein